MGNFNRGGGDRFGGRQRSGGNDRGFGRGDRPTMHQATCSDCGSRCEVPFKPTGSKPVYCSDCFSNQEGGNNDRGGNRDRGGRNDRFERRSSDRGGFGDKPKFKAVCDKCHESCEVPFKPTSGKPIFCSNCFGSDDKGGNERRGGGAGKSDQNVKQFEMLSEKLDKIINLLSSDMKEVKPKKPTEKKEKPVKKEEKKEVKEKKAPVKKRPAVPKKVVKKAPAKKKPAAKKPAKKAPAKKKK